MYSKIETFNKVKKHLLNQKERAMNSHGACSYFNDSGLKCAVGCLIPESLYESTIEGICIEDIIKNTDHFKCNKELEKHDIELLKELQYIHDETPIEIWDYHLMILEEKIAT